ncbi:MAG: acyl carrier protein [Flavobacteriales bacterium]|nr:acyl carrier protein [Flavobacteriales bacterium]
MSDSVSVIISIIVENLGVEESMVTRDARFSEDLGANSLDTVEIIMELEIEFSITITDEEAENIKTVGEAIDYIENNT